MEKDQRWQKLAFKPQFFIPPSALFFGLFVCFLFQRVKHQATLYPLFLLLNPFIVQSCLSELIALGRGFILNYVYYSKHLHQQLGYKPACSNMRLSE